MADELSTYPEPLQTIDDPVLRSVVKQLFVRMVQYCNQQANGGVARIDMTVTPDGRVTAYTSGIRGRISRALFDSLWEVDQKYPGYISSMEYYNPRNHPSEDQAEDLEHRNVFVVHLTTEDNLVPRARRASRTRRTVIATDLDAAGGALVLGARDPRDRPVLSYIYRVLQALSDGGDHAGVYVDEENRDYLQLVVHQWSGCLTSQLVDLVQRANSADLFDYDPVRDIYITIPPDESDEAYNLVFEVNRRSSTIVRAKHIPASQPAMSVEDTHSRKRSNATAFDLSDTRSVKTTRVA